MKLKIGQVTIFVTISLLSGCFSSDRSFFYRDASYEPGLYSYDTSLEDGYYYQQLDNQPVPQKKQVIVPETYHVGAYHSPTSHRQRDNQWVNQQNPNGYTIEVARDKSPAVVAKSLMRAPKHARHAEVQYQSGTNTYYRGVYGSYSNYEEAKKAYDSLPADVKSQANIKPWSQIQQ